MAWWAVIIDATGAARSFTESASAPSGLPGGWVAVSIPQQPDATHVWNPATRVLDDFVPPPPEFMVHGNLSALTADDHPQYATDTDLTTHAATPHGGVHPDLATHTGLGLAASHAHPYSADDHTHVGGSHPDLATHTALGLAATAHNHDGAYAPTHAHPYSSDTHDHTGVYEPTHAHPYAATSHAHLDADIPAGVARDSEVAAAYSPLGHTHAGGSGPTILKKTADQIINGTAYQDITDLTFPVSADTDYGFQFYIAFRSTTATGFGFSVNGPAGVVDYVVRYQTVANSSGLATYLDRHDVGYNAMAALTATVAAGVDLYAKIEGRVKVGGSGGTLAARARSESANNDLVVQKGSWGLAI